MPLPQNKAFLSQVAVNPFNATKSTVIGITETYNRANCNKRSDFDTCLNAMSTRNVKNQYKVVFENVYNTKIVYAFPFFFCLFFFCLNVFSQNRN